jgi:N6-L-threonylcarbamoyladenine synthase
MKILAIESSCDETAAAVIEDGVKILSNVVVSQVDIFAKYGGVIPEVAARSHLEAILPVVEKALEDAGLTKEEIDAIAVTHTPGLMGSLLIGTLTARMLAILWGKPLYATHHLKSHIYANWLSTGETPEFPLLSLVISGGHTQIIYMREHNIFEIIGTTRDDAIGECFDKVAKILGLPYPGGPSIAKAALEGDASRYKLPHPKVEGLDFSFSGLKTAVLRAVQAELGLPITTPSYELKEYLSEQQRADFAASFQATACDILIDKLKMAVLAHPEAKSLVFAGGVSANQVLREKALKTLQNGPDGAFRKVYFPAPRLAGDNGAMVGAAAYFEVISGVEPTDPYALSIAPRTAIG